MAIQRSTSNLGLYVYGGAAIFLGVLGLVSGDFATTWQNVGPNIPMRVPLAYLTAVIELAGGIALLLPRTARAGALTLTIVYAVFTLIWVPKALARFPHNFLDISVLSVSYGQDRLFVVTTIVDRIE
jgi:uncharacterized membrane protein